ncbi:butyrophilin subfamily 1 member A1-like [Erpetoichthys calabaricus]|uniref:butyrophilin subfamily 1 member A1-like n=1 Tax=Erpetoichthys calabaricus TaxID=27687 RepID=UPI002234C329|nr:butyrophilin subfamily 1 member A1-like [Erpetoichthys calabaricus]XP_051782401.1 butyrophilin subfamily 1 member A1-like [Erpetoichthys calabaricus]
MIVHTGLSLFILWFLHHVDFSWAERFTVVGPSHSIVSYVGEDVILPASLSPALDAEGFEVRWFTTNIYTPLLLYADYKIINLIDSRRALFQEKLKSGNVSLIVQSVRVSDEGVYTCLVASGPLEEDVKITLNVEVLGAQPSITMSSTEGQKTRLECSAEKWNPQPEVSWRDMNRADVTSQSTIKSERDSEGLLRVSSVLPVKEEYNVFSCLMRSKAPKPDWPSELNIYSFSPGVSGWLVAFCVLLVLCLVATPLLVIQWRRMRETNTRYDSIVRFLPIWFLHKEIEKSQRITNAEWRRICSSAADVTFDPETAHPRLIVSEDGKEVRHTDTRQRVTDNPKRFDYCVCVLAREGFTSGRHYWEVEVGGKTMWDLGVARESVNRKGGITVTPYDGYWTVCLRNENEYTANIGRPLHLPLRVKPQTVGVFLDYDEGQVSFYNAQSRSHLYTFTDSFTEPLYPYFSPCNNDGGKNAAPLVICPLRTH